MAEQTRSKTKDAIIWLSPTIAIVYLIWYLAVKIELIGSVARNLEFIPNMWDYLGALLFIVLIVILILSIPSRVEALPEAQVAEVVEEIPEAKEVVQIEEQHVEVVEEVPNIISYPKEVEGGIYNDTLIQFDANSFIKLKTLIAKWNEDTNKLEIV